VWILSLLHYPHFVLIGTAWMALTIVPRSLSEAVQGVLRGIHQYWRYLIIEFVLGGTLLAGAAALVVKHGGLEMAITVEVLASVAAGLAGLVIALKLRTKERIRVSASRLFNKSLVFNAYGLIANLYDRFDVVLLSKLAGNYATGIYSVAYRAVGMMQIVGYGVLYSLLPTLSRGVLPEVERKRLAGAMGLLMSIGYFIVLATMVFAGPAVQLILGPQYSESEKVLKILIWAVVIRYLNYALNTGLLAGGNERVFVRTSFICFALNLIGNLLLIPRFGWRAAAAMTIMTELALLLQNVYWIRRIGGEVVRPWAGGRTSLAFSLLLATGLIGAHLRIPNLSGAACLILYVAYLYRSGIIKEFAAVWSSEGSVQYGLPNEPEVRASSVLG
jgi:O-antigen/teichoic acid export membrane protein